VAFLHVLEQRLGAPSPRLSRYSRGLSHRDGMHEPPESIGLSLGVLIARVAAAARERQR
jgi:hypothetical protein